MQDKQTYTLHQEAQPLVTFIVTCYNLPVPMLSECLDSILALPIKPDEREIIVVDDGSEESPMDKMKDYADHIVYLRKPNGGVSTARNMGLRTAGGRYIQFVDGDDRLIPATYQHCLDIMKAKQPDIVAFDFTDTRVESTDYEDYDATSGCEMLKHQNIKGAAWLYLFRNSILGELCFTPGISYGEDEEFTPQLLLRADRVIKTSAKAYYYRQHEASAIGNKTTNGIQKRLNDNLKVIRSLKAKVDTLPTDERLALERRTAQLTMDYIYNTIVLTGDSNQLHERIDILRNEGLFPLPNHNYTTKYTWFRRMSNTSAGLALLMKVLPLMKRER